MSDGKEAKFLFLDDLSKPTSKTEKFVDAEIVRKWLEHTKGKCEFIIHEGVFYNLKNIFEKENQKKMAENLEKIKQEVYEASGVTVPTYEFFEDMARHYDLSYDEFVSRAIGGFKTRPIRKEQTDD